MMFEILDEAQVRASECSGNFGFRFLMVQGGSFAKAARASCVSG